MELTDNLSLRKPAQDDFYDVDDFNHNADILDQAITENDAGAVHKTGNETVSGVKTFNDKLNILAGLGYTDVTGQTTDANLLYLAEPLIDQHYICSTDAGASSIGNIPESKAFILRSITVMYTSQTAMLVRQILMQSGKNYTRYCRDGVWSDWREMAMSDAFLPLTGGRLTGTLEVLGMVSEGTVPSITCLDATKEVMVTTGALDFRDSGGFLALYGREHGNEDVRGGFTLTAKDSENNRGLLGLPDGTLDWGGKHVIRQESAGKGDNGYCTFSNGLKMCWMRGQRGNSNPVDITLPISFSNTNYRTIVTDVGDGMFAWGATPVAVNRVRMWGHADNTGYHLFAIGF